MSDTEEKKRGLPIRSIFAIMVKYTKVMKFMQLLKLLKFSKIFLSFGTMVLSIFVYSYSLGLLFSIGFVLMIFVHEMGHVFALKLKGYQTSLPVFIPMLGAVIFAPNFSNPDEEAYVGYGGPLLGGIASLAMFGLWLVLPGNHNTLLAVSYFSAFINLFNLIPIRPLDGGRVTQAIGSKFKWVGLTVMVLFSFWIKQPGILLIWILIIEDLGFSPPVKFLAGFSSLITMAVLFLLGYGDQPVWVNILDCALGSLFVFVMYITMKKSNTSPEEVIPEPPANVKLKWLLLYTTLAIGLTSLMFVQGSYLPVIAHR